MKKISKDLETSRRGFLSSGALLGAGILLSASADDSSADQGATHAVMRGTRPDKPYEQVKPENRIYSACLQCNTGCGISCKQQDGVITKIDGNPYNPWNLLPHLTYATDPDDAAPVDGSICPKGQAGIQTAYDPYRLRKVLKRAGKRGENKWLTIPFDKAIEEICEGGNLFAHVAGEENRKVTGIRELIEWKDPHVAKAMAVDVKAILAEKDRTKKHVMVEQFKAKHQGHLDKLIDADHPDLGPINNQIVLAWGRMKGGRTDLYKRLANALGTVNAHGHTTVCQGSLYFTSKAISEQYVDGKFSDGKKFYWQADTENSRFIFFVGANLFEANYGPPNRSIRLTANLVSGATKIAVADPRFSKVASKAWKWLPIKPGTDAALAMGMIRWIIEEKRYDATFLSCANKAAALGAGETSWCNATWLVEIKNGVPGKFVRAADVGLAEPETRKGKDGTTYPEKFLVAMSGGNAVAFDPNDTKNPVTADLFVSTKLANGIEVKSALQVLRETAQEKSVSEWAQIAGVKESELIAVARELTSHGKRAAVDIHRGVSQHTNGFYNVLAWMSVNMLIGNFDAKGGMIKATTYDFMGKGKLFNLSAHPGKPVSFGISCIRHGIDYEKTTLFKGYPAQRNWYPLSSDVYEEIIPSIGKAYPYPVKVLFTYMGAPTYSLPAGHTNIEVLCDTEKLPLFVANDILVGNTSIYADYIFPDLSYLERWEFQGSHPSMPCKVQPVRQPAMAPITENCKVFGQEMPLSFESMVLGFAERLHLSGFGKDAFSEGLDLKHPDDFYIRAVANLAWGEKPDGTEATPDATKREMEIFMGARKHLPSGVFEVDRWSRTATDRIWPKLVYVLNRGGRFEDHARAYRGQRVAHPYGALLNLYQEKTASTIHSGTGEGNRGHAVYVPIRDFHGHEPKQMREGYDLALITHRSIVHTKSRTIVDPWLSPLMPTNGILLNPSDAKRLGLAEGQLVKMVSATNPSGEWPLGAGKKKDMVGQVVFTQTMRPGVTSFVLGFGHWATGASDFFIDGVVVRGDSRRAPGIHSNAAMWVDPVLKNICMFDPVGGSVSFYDTYIRLIPVAG